MIRAESKLCLVGGGLLVLAGGACLWSAGLWSAPERAPAPVALDPGPGLQPATAESTAEPAPPPLVPEQEVAPARAALEEWLAGLARELVHEPYQPRVFRERLEGCLAAWTPELRAELERWLADPPAVDADFVALASLGRAQAIRLAPALASRLRPLALREDVPFGVALESARALVAGGGVAELAWWSGILESAREPRQRAIAAGALDALRDGAAERFLIERALELEDPRAAARLLDALGRALEDSGQLSENPARKASAARLAELAGDGRAEAGLRARALGVLRCLDPEAAERLASDWFLEPGAGPERIEFATSSLRGRKRAWSALVEARADPRLDDLRRVRLAECVLFTEPEQQSPEALAAGLEEMRSALRDSRDGAARRRALHALARFGTDEDRARVQQAAEGDPDPLARAAASSALRREASDWR